MPEVLDHKLIWKKDGMAIEVISKDALLSQEVIKQVFLQQDKEELLNIDMDVVYDQTLKDEVEKRLGFSYPYKKEAGLKVKMTVSELKKLGQDMDEEQSVILFQNQNANEADHIPRNQSPQPDHEINKEIPKESLPEANLPGDNIPVVNLTEFDATIPNFISQKEITSGTDRGTLYHKVLELMDLRRVLSSQDVRTELDRLVLNKRLKDTDIKLLKLDYLKRFVSSNVAERMRKAEYAGKLFKEKQFVMGIKASEVMKDSDSSELILIQGIIDVFFEENGELVLLDYKSDLVADETQLVKRYKVQLEYYRKALEQMLQKKVREMIIYSLPLGKEIRIDE
jgi:ATP-dependent helicase/nuclease subunit A